MPKKVAKNASETKKLEEKISDDEIYEKLDHVSGENRTSESPTFEEVEIDSDDKEYFFAGISCGYDFRNLIELLLRFSNAANFTFETTGFSYNYVHPQKQCLVSMDFPSDRLNSYAFKNKNDNPIHVGIDMEKLFKNAKQIRVKTMLRMFRNPDDESKVKCFYIQIHKEEGADINNALYIPLKYVNITSDKIPIMNRNPDRVIAFSEFEKLGNTMKSIDSPYIYLTRKTFKNSTLIHVDIKMENNSSGGIHIFQNPSVYNDNDTECLQKANVRIPKSFVDKFCNYRSSDAVVRVFVEDAKYVIFELSFTYIGFLRILIKHEPESNK